MIRIHRYFYFLDYRSYTGTPPPHLTPAMTPHKSPGFSPLKSSLQTSLLSPKCSWLTWCPPPAPYIILIRPRKLSQPPPLQTVLANARHAQTVLAEDGKQVTTTTTTIMMMLLW